MQNNVTRVKEAVSIVLVYSKEFTVGQVRLTRAGFFMITVTRVRILRM